MSKKWILATAMTISVTVMAACGDDDTDSPEVTDEELEQEEQQEAPEGEEMELEDEEAMELPDEPDMDDFPDPVAEVNGEPISSEQFGEIYSFTLQTAAMQGIDPEDEESEQMLIDQTLEQLIGLELLTQAAEEQGYEVTDEEVDEQLQQEREQAGLDDEEEYIAFLEEQGLDEEELRQDISEQLKIDRFIEEETEQEDVSDEEVEEVYEQVAEMQGDDAPELDEIREDLEDQIRQQNESEQVQGLVNSLREESDVEVHI
ncbi:SurA N-terminal domain-containing protein [Thalassorhabdus alkalitolerans]|uniref:SurA N-terminal domain-containing protein n=1 Tax=Thalassorhabdus alkalitolerans TaxID=2282697 RepID=A0ABW0YHH7_9BACI|nr:MULTISPECIES: SurA N-terminal domain-containing protein [Bacillaceae]